MSDIDDNCSITSEMAVPVHCSTLRQTPGKDDVLQCSTKHTGKETLKSEIITSNPETNTDNNTEPNLIKMNNNDETRNYNGSTENVKHKDGNENKVTKLKIIIPSSEHYSNNEMNVINDISKSQSAIIKTDTTEFVLNMKEKESTPTRPIKQNRPIMGRTALLKKANTDRNDSVIVHDLVNGKYNNIVNHYTNRMSQRRRSRLDFSEGFYSDTVFSSPPIGYSPLSVSSINTPNSVPTDEKTGFHFPVNAQSSDYRFLVSTDDMNIDTTTEATDESSINSIDNTNEKSATSMSEYDPRKFLENAIGEVTNISKISTCNSNVVYNEKNDQQPDNCSVGTSELSALISRASTIYDSWKTNIKKNFSFKATTISVNDNTKKKTHESSNVLKIEDLMKKLSIQNEILLQVSKALQFCKKTKEFQDSPELIEAEKILLVTTRTREVIADEIYKAENDLDQYSDHRSCGLVEIRDLKFSLRNKQSTHNRDFAEYFLVLLTCESTVQASEIVEADENGIVNIKKWFKFTELSSDFEITLTVHSMKLGRRIQQCYEHRSLSPKNLFHLHRNSKKFTIPNEILIRPSSFTVRGKYHLSSSELSKVKQTGIPSTLILTMYHTALASSLSRIFSIDIRSEVKLTNKIKGFLTIGTKNERGCTIWNRRWCALDGSILRYWNYPSEEVADPLRSVDLSYCLDQEILVADRSLCARPRTLILTVQSKHILKEYLLSADNCEDLRQWQKELNYVITSQRVWNCLNTI